MIAGVGIDVVDVARIKALLDAKGERVLERLLTEEERRYCARKPRPEQHIAVRVAAKEAVFKALSGAPSARGIGWREIEVRTDDDGRPRLLLHGRAGQRAAELRVNHHWLSLTHGDTVAAAVVVLETRE
ncbi:MAG TPA: holo-ACP synthase [Gemmatimonadaceae bacterium]|nr:holo-ACP synthase [Gemmatimonadaceae bacterium]